MSSGFFWHHLVFDGHSVRCCLLRCVTTYYTFPQITYIRNNKIYVRIKCPSSRALLFVIEIPFIVSKVMSFEGTIFCAVQC